MSLNQIHEIVGALSTEFEKWGCVITSQSLEECLTVTSTTASGRIVQSVPAKPEFTFTLRRQHFSAIIEDCQLIITYANLVKNFDLNNPDVFELIHNWLQTSPIGCKHHL